MDLNQENKFPALLIAIPFHAWLILYYIKSKLIAVSFSPADTRMHLLKKCMHNTNIFVLFLKGNNIWTTVACKSFPETVKRGARHCRLTLVKVKGVRCPVSLVPLQSRPPILECYLSHDYTWDPLTSVPFLSLDQLLTPALYPSSFVLCPRLNTELPGEQKRSWGSYEKRK